MNKKDSNFFEEHVEKIVLVVVGLGCLWLFITRVLFSPVRIEYGNKKFNPGTIDSYIDGQVTALENKINRKPEPKQPYQPRVGDFVALYDSAVSDINTGLSLPQPINLKEIPGNRAAYHIPLVGEVSDALAEHIRTVAYVPKEGIGEEKAYSSENSEPNDIDLVTVEAKFDVSGLYKRYNVSFAGDDIPQDWRDPCLAKPVFASVQLQRQELLSDGSWSDWQTVPRSKIDPRKRTFEDIEDISDLPAGGIKVRRLQFDDGELRRSLLQPEPYKIASAKEEWFPPSLHEKYLEYQKELSITTRRAVAEEKKEAREGERTERRGKQAVAKTRPTAEGVGGATGEGMDPLLAASNASRKASSAKGTQPDRKPDKERPQKIKESVSKTADDVSQRFNEIKISQNADFAKMDKPLVFWAYDDTVGPGKYRYRIRLGVFNPIAGTNQFSEQDKALKNKVILWSEFSDQTDVVDIPGKLYFFPRDIQEATRVVTVQVSRYVLGNWYSKDFAVKQGELIGKISEYKMTDEEETKKVKVPQVIDYSTGAVVVDIVPVTDWSGGNNLHVNHFFDLLYSFNGKDTERLPIKTRYWTDSLQNKFNEIKKYEKEAKEPLRSFGGGVERISTVQGQGQATGEGMPEGMGP